MLNPELGPDGRDINRKTRLISPLDATLSCTTQVSFKVRFLWHMWIFLRMSPSLTCGTMDFPTELWEVALGSM